jgi:hypothetical protein
VAELDPSEAQRLTRLRVLLADAHRRVDDRSDLGEHLAVIALDGIGELAIGLCMHKRGLRPKQREGVPDMLRRLTEDLDVVDPPGARGYRELHRMRNMVQHQGVLPAANQMPLWLAETERLIDFLVDRSFGLGLAKISSASGVRDERLRAALAEADAALESGDPKASFERSWQTLQQGRDRLRSESAPGASTFRRPVGFQDIDRPLESLQDGLKQVAERLEFAAFTSEPAEWLWFEQRHNESMHGPPPDEGEARRALAFVVGWVLRFDSYLARQREDRWADWEQGQQAPVTGIPGGPHIREVKSVETRRIVRTSGTSRVEVDAFEWTFQLTDIPDTGTPGFEWALTEAARNFKHNDITHVYSNPGGLLCLSASKGISANEIVEFIDRAIDQAKANLQSRAQQEEEQLRLNEAIVAPFRKALVDAGIPVLSVSLVLGDPARHTDARVAVRVDRSDRGHVSWFAQGLQETFDDGAAPSGEQLQQARLGFDGVQVPTTWTPDAVACWVGRALEFDEQRWLSEQREAKEAEEIRISALCAMREAVTRGRRPASTENQSLQ